MIRDLPHRGGELPDDRGNLIGFIDRLFAEGYSGKGESASLTRTPPWLPVLFSRYGEALIRVNRLDFGSLLHFAARMLREKSAVARVVRFGWTHVCVSEFQDPNRAQYTLLRLLGPARNHNLFVVAEDDYRLPIARCEPPAVSGPVTCDIRERGPSASDCAVLGRYNRLIPDAAERLRKAAFDACHPEEGDFDSTLLTVVVEALRLAISRHDRIVLGRLCRTWEGLTEKTMAGDHRAATIPRD